MLNLHKPEITRISTAHAPIRCAVGESPIWIAHEAAWYWVDITANTIWRLEKSGAVRSWHTAEMIACMSAYHFATHSISSAADADAEINNNFIAGMESGIFRLHLHDDGSVDAQALAAPAVSMHAMRFNDGRCDRQGRFWSGTMLLDMSVPRAAGHLYRYTKEEGISAPFISNLYVQNGLAWSPDGRTMYLSDSHPHSQLIWAFDYDTTTGTPSNQRVFVDMKPMPGRPDGAAIDVDGCYWICANDAGLILRFTPAGKLDRQIAVPMKKPTMCCFGGDKLDTLMVTSIAAGQAPDDEWAGATILLDPGVQGMAETSFAG